MFQYTGKSLFYLFPGYSIFINFELPLSYQTRFEVALEHESMNRSKRFRLLQVLHQIGEFTGKDLHKEQDIVFAG